MGSTLVRIIIMPRHCFYFTRRDLKNKKAALSALEDAAFTSNVKII